MTKILILGGTAEAVALARALEDWPDAHVITSLAGRTRSPKTQNGALRVGGFGGVQGLARYLRDETMDILIDATHPFAAQMSGQAREASERAGIPCLKLLRPPWHKELGDCWIEVENIKAAAAHLRGTKHRVFLTSGHKDIEEFADLGECWFLIRTIEPVTGPLPGHHLCLNARGPFDEASEIALLQKHRIDRLVTKASGGVSTYAKVAAARSLGIPVIMIKRPTTPPGPIVQSIDDALAWLRQVDAQARGLRT